MAELEDQAFSVNVTDERGQPVRGALVRIYRNGKAIVEGEIVNGPYVVQVSKMIATLQVEVIFGRFRSKKEVHTNQGSYSVTIPAPKHSWLIGFLRKHWRLATVCLILIVVVLWLYWHYCPPVTVPVSHFVKQPQHKKVIIFVHGVLGDIDNTWVHPGSHVSWPELLAGDKDFGDYDIYVYGYQTGCGDSSNIYEIATRFAQQLRDDHFFSNYQQISFITHSMGGLVTKRMLATFNTPQEIDNLQRVRTVLLISVPSAGANIASVASWLSINPQFKNMSPDDAQAFLQTVEGDWANLMRNRSPKRPFPRSFVAYETRDLKLLKIVPALFTSGVSDLPPIAFDYDHVGIVKPDSRKHDVYKWAKARILESSDYGTDDAGFVLTPLGNPTFAEIVDMVNRLRHTAIRFSSTCRAQQRNAFIQVNGAKLEGKNTSDFFESAIKPRLAVNFEFVTKVPDISYEIQCRP